MPMKFKSFASDNNAGTHPEILKAITECNEGHVIGYGDDPYTEEAVHNFKVRFGQDTDVYFVYGGTGANVLGLKTIADSYHSILCAETSHIYVDECSAPEKFTGCKLQPIPTADGKLTPEQIEPYLHGFGFPHHAQPKVISITQPTEMGTVYSVPEIRELRRLADTYGLFLHMDGARISNAAARLDKTFKEFSVDAGVDVLSFGGTKNGMMFGEAVLFFNKSLSEAFKYI
jgi:threonine aldolase